MIKKEDIYIVIMAGGRGERFWPQSRVSKPKQLLRLLGNLTLIEQTVERLLPMASPENILIITNGDYVAPMQSLLSMIPPSNIIGEPTGRDTAPCIATAAAYIKAKSKVSDPVMIVLPADHSINDVESLRNTLTDCVEAASKGKIITIGVPPSYPSTGYGYIHCGDKLPFNYKTIFHASLGFKEKPDLQKATEFLKDGTYKWNSGMFIWSLSTFTLALQKYFPSLYDALITLEKAAKNGTFLETLDRIYDKMEKISIDYSVMEKADNVIVAECPFDWDDVGSWTALRNQIRPESNNNVVRGLHVGLDSKNCIIVGESTHLIATVDVDDLIIVNTEDATLVCNGKSAQRIKELLQLIASRPELGSFT